MYIILYFIILYWLLYYIIFYCIILIWTFHVSPPQTRRSSGMKISTICGLVRRLRDLSSQTTKILLGSKGLQKPTCAGQTHQQGIGAHRGYRITMKTHREKPWKNQTFGGCFFPFNLFHKNCTSVHFWWAGQDLVVLSTLERPRHQAFSCLPKKSPTPSIPVGKSQLWTCPHPLPAQPSQQPGPQQSEIF